MSMQPELDAAVAEFRDFNRRYTQFLGTLREGLLESPFTLPQARVIYEIASRKQTTASEIGNALDLDPGYLSRLLGSLRKARVVTQTRSAADRRNAVLRLTAAGLAAFRKLDQRSAEQARAFLNGLSPQTRETCGRALRTLKNALPDESASGTPPPFVLRPHRIGDMGWVVYREAAVYAQEFGWNADFEALVARIVGEFITNFNPQRERCWMAEANGENVGHIFLVQHPENKDVAKLRLLLVESSARGLGLGHALVQECIRFARSARYKEITLWTQSILHAAHKIYQRAGFRLQKEEPHHSFGHDLVGQTWSLSLDSA